MKTIVLAIVAMFFASSAVLAGTTEPPGQMDNSWGDLTSEAIAGGFDQGAHASDPSGDGKGKETRVGLGNAGGGGVGSGDLSKTIDLIESNW